MQRKKAKVEKKNNVSGRSRARFKPCFGNNQCDCLCPFSFAVAFYQRKAFPLHSPDHIIWGYYYAFVLPPLFSAWISGRSGAIGPYTVTGENKYTVGGAKDGQDGVNRFE